ncbi:MAG: hypothetical protein WD267_01110 [Balneolales bacterium]
MDKKTIKILSTTMLVYALLVSTHQGEFWPFSIYPMFSQGANPWTRAAISDVTQVDDSLKWNPSEIDRFNGSLLAMNDIGVDQIDFSNYISKTIEWNIDRLEGLRTMIGEEILEQKELMIMKVNGLIHDDDHITVEAVPFILLTRDNTYLNPNLPESAYYENPDHEQPL